MPERAFSLEQPTTLPSRKPRREWKETSGVFDMPDIQKEHLHLKHIRHDLSRRYQPQFLGKGGEHLVYEVAGSPNVVVKGEKMAMAEIFDWNLRHGMPPDTESEAVQRIREGRLKEQRELYEQLKKHFGKEHVLPQKKFVVNVPVNGAVLAELKNIAENQEWKMPEYTSKAWTILTVQERTPVLEDPERLTPFGTNVEMKSIINGKFKDPEFLDAYHVVTDPYMNGQMARTYDLWKEGFRRVIKTPELNELLTVLQDDPKLRKTMKDFLKRTIAFAEATGEIIDFGRDNVVFYQKDDREWDYLLVDPFFGLMPKILSKAREAYTRLSAGSKYRDNETLNALLQATSFTRMVNGLSKICGADEFLDFLPLKNGEPPDVLGTCFPQWARKEPL